MSALLNDKGGEQGFGENIVPRNDDSYVQNIDITPYFGPEGLNFFGTSYTQLSINNNGNITFGPQGLYTYTPFGLQEANNIPIIAAYFADVDTRATSNLWTTPGGNSTGTNLAYYSFSDAGHGELTVTWDDVGYYSYQVDKLNAFQLQLIGTGNGNFDIVMRYEDINWTTGGASGGSNGLGGVIARAGYTTGDGSTWYEFPQSGNQQAMLALDEVAGNTGIVGEWRFSVNNGVAGEEVHGGSSSDILTAVGSGVSLYGYGGDDTLRGLTGDSWLYGGTGNDLYIVSPGDTVIELGGEGIDTIMTEHSWTLPDFVENLTLTGSANVNGIGNNLHNLLIGNAGDNILDGRGGINTVSYDLARSGVTVDLRITEAQWIDAANGNDILLNIHNLIGSRFNDTLIGNDDRNILQGGGGNNFLDGQGGMDQARFEASFAAYTIAFGNDGIVTVSNGLNTDTLINIERLGFTDRTWAVDPDDYAYSLFRLYQAAFDRAPDLEGLGYWVHVHDYAGHDLAEIARSFVASAEFEETYGELSDLAYIQQLYLNILGREGEQGGVNHWLGDLSSGVQRSEVMAHFANSAENIEGTADAVSGGVWWTDWMGLA